MSGEEFKVEKQDDDKLTQEEKSLKENKGPQSLIRFQPVEGRTGSITKIMKDEQLRNRSWEDPHFFPDIIHDSIDTYIKEIYYEK